MAMPVEVKVKMDSPLTACDAISGVRALYQKAELCDMEFRVNDQVFPVHQGILACGSSNFRTFLKHVVEQTADDNDADAALKGMLSVVQHAVPQQTGEVPTEAAKVEESAAAATSATAPPPSDSVSPPAVPAAGNEPAPAPCEKPPSDAQAQAAASASEPPAAAAAAAPSTGAMEVSAPAPPQDAGATGTVPTTSTAASADTPAASAEPAPTPAPVAEAHRRLELQVAGITHPEALTIMLNYIYEVGAGQDWRYEPSSKEVNKDVLRLAKSFGLHHLHDHGARWLTRKLTTSNVVERLVTMEDFGLGSLREKVIEQLAWKPEELGMVSTSPEIMQHPRILQDILVKVASQRGKAQKKEPPAPAPVEEKPDVAAQEAAARAKEAAEKEAADKAAAEKAAIAKAAEARAAAAEAEAKAATAKAAAAAAEAERWAAQRAVEEKAAADKAAAEKAAAEEQAAREAETMRRTMSLAERLSESAKASTSDKPGKQEKLPKPNAKASAKGPPAKRQKKN